MTAEIAVLSPQAVALAADSAVTLSGPNGQKIFSTAEKIFALSHRHPVGIMVYGSSAFMDLPWDTVIKTYRDDTADRSFPTIADHAHHFRAWLASAPIFDEEAEWRLIEQAASRELPVMGDLLAGELDAAAEGRDTIPVPAALEILRRLANERQKELRQWPGAPADASRNRLASRHRKQLDELIRESFADLPLPTTGPLMTALRRVSVLSISAAGDRQAGVVIAGFGSREYRPALEAFQVLGIADGTVLHRPVHSYRVGPTPKDSAAVLGFAQADAMSLFMEGVDPDYQEMVESHVTKTVRGLTQHFCEELGIDASDSRTSTLHELGDKSADELVKQLRQLRWKRTKRPILDVVANLPKMELGGLAESLVNLSSLKRRVSHDVETVGGAVDVAIISRGDGLVWIQRKHYFDPYLNPHFAGRSTTAPRTADGHAESARAK